MHINEQTETVQVWKALADPVRRQLMDLVRESPKTTGDLVSKFESIGRCAVMKHLGILEKANLITVRREGKYRWNYINAIPLQEIYERWVKKYEAQWATNLLQLKEVAEYKSNIDTLIEDTVMQENNQTIKINLEIPIKAPIQQVWECLIKDVGIWWRKDFYTSTKTVDFIIEPVVGGRMYEDYGNNEGLLWANVIIVDSPKVLELKGHLSPQFGGPAFSFLRLTLEENDSNTVLNLSDTVFGDVSENTKKDLTSGWQLLFEDTFKEYAESKS
ncbi:helix-turn-helix domain-containing protein [Fulvivirgaceae bacterium BMA10]|uniref:Helix-turn-helix domain-containing protein n=1 Tax=Splendidivirga corallicola TaxID=3051826 RepID=A0ABT8KWM2_9BACT|nr:helix-turn-helix domain-containing protein [Fulvivirgaceae bacterium BMA10]